MAKGKGRKAPLTFEQKMEKDEPEFVASLNGLTVAQLEARIAKYQKELQDSEEHRDNNEALRNAKEELAQLSGPYRDVRAGVKKKTRYIISQIRAKGGA